MSALHSGWVPLSEVLLDIAIHECEETLLEPDMIDLSGIVVQIEDVPTERLEEELERRRGHVAG